MTNPYYTPTGTPQSNTRGTSAPMRSESNLVAAGFDAIYQTRAPGTSTPDPASTEFVTLVQVDLQASIDNLQAQLNASTGTPNAWVSGTTYTMGVQVYSPINFQTYRRKTNGAGATDPSLDPTNWLQLTGLTFFDEPVYWM